jgi:hypothetical protein
MARGDERFCAQELREAPKDDVAPTLGLHVMPRRTTG